MSDTHEAITSEKRRNNMDIITQDVQGACAELQKTAEALYNPVLHRQKQANGDRNALNMVQQNRFLFNLPER